MENSPPDDEKVPNVSAVLPSEVLAQLAELDAAERGFVLALLLPATQDSGALATTTHNLAGTSGARCTQMMARIEVLPRPQRLQLLGILAHEVLAPAPAGLENIHPAVLTALLDKESDAVLLALAAHGPIGLRAVVAQLTLARAPARDAPDAEAAPVTMSPAVRAELLRAVLAPVVSVPEPPTGVIPRRLGRRLASLSAERLIAEVRTAGAGLLGTSLRGAREDTLENLGVRALGVQLRDEDPDVTLSVAQRLPTELGRALLAAAYVNEV